MLRNYQYGGVLRKSHYSLYCIHNVIFLGCLASVYAEDKFIEIAGVRLPGKDASRVTDARKLRFIPEGSRAVQAHESGVSAG